MTNKKLKETIEFVHYGCAVYVVESNYLGEEMQKSDKYKHVDLEPPTPTEASSDKVVD